MPGVGLARRRPLIGLISLGGTIASRHSATGVSPDMSALELLAGTGVKIRADDVRVTSLRTVPSTDLTMQDLLAVCRTIQDQAREGVDGFVITQGTDTLEDAAFIFDSLMDTSIPVVVTGSLRAADDPGADGPANLLAAMHVATDSAARDLGVLVVFGDEIHSAQFVRKTHTAKPSAFNSPAAGPIGFVTEGRVTIVAKPIPRMKIPLSDALETRSRDVRVGHLSITFDDDGALLEAASRLGYSGIVVQALGGGHVPAQLVDILTRLSGVVPVVLASRTGAGTILKSTYSYPGSECDLLGRGLIAAGMLDSHRARLLLHLLLASGASRAEIFAGFALYGGGH